MVHGDINVKYHCIECISFITACINIHLSIGYPLYKVVHCIMHYILLVIYSLHSLFVCGNTWYNAIQESNLSVLYMPALQHIQEVKIWQQALMWPLLWHTLVRCFDSVRPLQKLSASPYEVFCIMFAHLCLVMGCVVRTHKSVWFPHINNKVVHSNHAITFTLLLQHDATGPEECLHNWSGPMRIIQLNAWVADNFMNIEIPFYLLYYNVITLKC